MKSARDFRPEIGPEIRRCTPPWKPLVESTRDRTAPALLTGVRGPLLYETRLPPEPGCHMAPGRVAVRPLAVQWLLVAGMAPGCLRPPSAVRRPAHRSLPMDPCRSLPVDPRRSPVNPSPSKRRPWITTRRPQPPDHNPPTTTRGSSPADHRLRATPADYRPLITARWSPPWLASPSLDREASHNNREYRPGPPRSWPRGGARNP